MSHSPVIIVEGTDREILDGPSKEILKLALFDRQPLPHRTVFRVSGKVPYYEVVVNSIAIYEDRIHDVWVIRGRAYGYADENRLVPQPPANVRINFRTDTRKGRIVFGDDINRTPLWFSVDVLDISEEVRIVFKEQKIYSIGELIAKTEGEILSFVGRKAFNQVKVELAKVGRHFAN